MFALVYQLTLASAVLGGWKTPTNRCCGNPSTCKAGTTCPNASLYNNQTCTVTNSLDPSIVYVTCPSNTTGSTPSAFKRNLGSLEKRAAAPIRWPGSYGYGIEYFGCMANDIVNCESFADDHYTFTSASLTPYVCSNTCWQNGYSVSGVANGNLCRCSNSYNCLKLTTRLNGTYCNAPCTANNTLACGGSTLINGTYQPTSVYLNWHANNLSTYQNFGPQVFYETPSTPIVGCFKNLDSIHTPLNDAIMKSSKMTPQLCTAYCSSQYMYLSGVFNGSTCYCGIGIWSLDSVMADVNNACNQTVCSGDPTLSCGSPKHTLVYYTDQNTYDQWNRQYKYYDIISQPPNITTSTTTNITVTGLQNFGCYSNPNSGFDDLFADDWVNLTSSAMTPALCAKQCLFQVGYPISGLLNGTSCRCSSDLVAFKYSNLLPASSCSKPCAGNNSTKCGGPSGATTTNTNLYFNWAMFAKNLTAYTPSTPKFANVTGSPVFGCFVMADKVNWPLFDGYGAPARTSAQNTPASCISYCKTTANILAPLAAVSGSDCYCSTAMYELHVNRPDTFSSCLQTACPGNTTQACGGYTNKRALVYFTGL